jgi:hypothetical protein
MDRRSIVRSRGPHGHTATLPSRADRGVRLGRGYSAARTDPLTLPPHLGLRFIRMRWIEPDRYRRDDGILHNSSLSSKLRFSFGPVTEIKCGRGTLPTLRSGFVARIPNIGFAWCLVGTLVACFLASVRCDRCHASADHIRAAASRRAHHARRHLRRPVAARPRRCRIFPARQGQSTCLDGRKWRDKVAPVLHSQSQRLVHLQAASRRC